MKGVIEWILRSFLLLGVIKGIHGGTYSIVHPKLFRIDSDEVVAVNLHGYGNANVKVHAQLTDYPHRRNIFSEKHEDGNANIPITFTMKVTRDKFPDVNTIVNKKVEMHIRIQFTSGGHSDISRNILIYLTGESDYLFVQTNRPIYKPGETVEVRVASLNTKMLPMRGADNAVEVAIKTSEGVRIWKTTKTFPMNEFILAEYEIPDNPPLGIYFVEAKLQSKAHNSTGSTEFMVDKYVLPTYNVEIQLDQNTVRPGDEIIGKFQAKYSYGEAVVGTYGITATLHIPGKEPIDFFQKPSTPYKRPGLLRKGMDGTGPFAISTRNVETASNMAWGDLIEARATVTIVVSVMGEAEGILESDSKEGILITNTPYIIDMSQSSKYFIPSMNHDVKVIVRDVVTKEVVPNVHVVLTVDGVRKEGREPTDNRGYAQIPVETRENSDRRRLVVRTDDSKLRSGDQAQVNFTLERHDSSHGYLKIISAPSHAVVETDVHVQFKTMGHQPAELYIMVLSRGMILRSEKRPMGQGVVSQSIRITRKMSPSIRVVGYYMHGNNIVSDAVTIDIDDVCISEELTITVEPEVIRPGGTVTISYQGEPMALIGTAAVDKAAYFLHNKGRLDRHKMFEKMQNFDMGCSASGGSTPLNVFEEAGLALTTATSSTTTKFNLDCPQEQEETRRKKRSLRTLTQGRAEEDVRLIKRCFRDGRRENLAGVRCDIRKLGIENPDYNNKILCIRAFLKGCELGEGIRESRAFRESKQRSSGSAGHDASSQPRYIKRTNFNEGWLWFTEHLDRDGGASHTPAPPHSITTYDIDAISVSDAEGFCVAKPAELKIFKDFFIQLYLPYSVKVMEQVQIRAALFNYHETRDREIHLRLRVGEELCTQGTPGEFSMLATLAVPMRSSKSFIFTAIPLSVPRDGKVMIEIEAEPVLSQDIIARDEIRRYLKVEPSGSELELTGSFQLEPSQRRPYQQIELNFPDSNIVPESKKCWIYGFMSFLGPIIEFDPISEEPRDLKDSIKIPWGCGEQNMMVMGPNVFAFNYLKYIGDPKPSTRTEVESLIIAGYTRQQGHRNNGLWSVYSGSSPTIWLNAYVDKVFLHAREVWEDMDITPICDSMAWLATQQRNDGSFSEGRHARYYTINVAKGGDEGLTAYVLIAVAETNADCPDGSLNSRIRMIEENAARYLRRTVHQTANHYTAAIVAYALALADPRHYSTRIANQRLLNARMQTGDESFWQNLPQPRITTIDIETTAYALLAQVALAVDSGSEVPQRSVEITNQIAKWMVSQQNDRGGFSSSQTTVTAIQSLTEYGKWIHNVNPPPINPHLDVTLSAPGTSWKNGVNFNLNKGHELYRKDLEIPSDVIEGTRAIDVAVTGEGRGSMSYRCIYRTTRDSEVCHFNITARTERIGHFGDDGESEASPGEGKDVMKLVLEISKISEGDSGMALIDISLISGFKPVEASLDAIVIGEAVDEAVDGAVDGVIDQYEIAHQNVILYVPKIQHSKPLKFGFKLQQTVTVNVPSPAKIVVYDYYNPEVTCSKFYSVPSGSPLLRTSCSPTSIDQSTEQLCKCAEGGCPTCRTREDQLEKTCGSRDPSSCQGCNERRCDNLRDSICRRNYGFIINITSIDKESMPQFIKMTANVAEVIHTLDFDTELQRNQERTFVIRKDCFEKCSDVSVKTFSPEGEYFVVGRTFLVRGKKPMKSTLPNGQQTFDYFLDKEAMLERTLDAAKCERYENRRNKCKGVGTEKCRNVRKKLKICDMQIAMRRGVVEGCD